LERADAPAFLLVEDDPSDAELVLRQLKRAGFTGAHHLRVDTEAALREALVQHPWSLIISDYEMPKFDGLAAFRVCSELVPDTPFVFVSGVLGEARAVEAMRAGASDYLVKDELGRLGAVVRRELAAASERRLRRRFEVDSAHERARLELAVDATLAGIFEHRLPLSRIYASQRCAEILDQPVGVLSRLDPASVRELVHPEDWPQLLAGYRSLCAGELEGLEREVRVARRDGEWRFIELHARAAERDPAGVPGRIVGLVRDVTQRRRNELQLQAAHKMEAVGRLAGGIAHDLNNYLSLMLALTHLLRQGGSGPSDTDDVATQLTETLKRAGTLTGQLLAFARRKPLASRALDINAAIEENVTILRHVVGEHIVVRTELASDVGDAMFDPDAFAQIALNVALNARDAMPGGGTLTISTISAELPSDARDVDAQPCVAVAFCDTGHGMDDETRRRVFEPFFTTKGKASGTGLGLSMCYGIVTQAGGKLDVSSEPGVGTVVTAFLPGAAQLAPGVAERIASRPPEQKAHRGGASILLAEDNEELARAVGQALTRLGYRVEVANDGRGALEAALRSATPFDLLITDVIMPIMGGPELARAWRTQYPNSKILFVSGYAQDDVALEAARGEDVLEKPFTIAALANKVRELLGPLESASAEQV